MKKVSGFVGQVCHVKPVLFYLPSLRCYRVRECPLEVLLPCCSVLFKMCFCSKTPQQSCRRNKKVRMCERCHFIQGEAHSRSTVWESLLLASVLCFRFAPSWCTLVTGDPFCKSCQCESVCEHHYWWWRCNWQLGCYARHKKAYHLSTLAFFFFSFFFESSVCAWFDPLFQHITALILHLSPRPLTVSQQLPRPPLLRPSVCPAAN